MKLEKLRTLVESQYLQKLPGRDPWSDWMYEKHITWTADRTTELCEQYDADPPIAVAAVLVHDIADSTMDRFNPKHKTHSLALGRTLCEQAGYTAEEIVVIIDDICLKHSCRDGIVPESHEGKVMATADALFHFETEFFLYAFHHSPNHSYEERMDWMRKKIEKDFHKKLFFKEIQEQTRPAYETLKRLCS